MTTSYKREMYTAYVTLVWLVIALFGLAGVLMKRQAGWAILGATVVAWVLKQIVVDGIKATLVLQALKGKDDE